MAEPAAPIAREINKTAKSVEKSATEVQKSAGAIEESAVVLTDSADRRTELASNRTLYAAERTYAAWVRTGLTALASGVGARPLLDPVLPSWLVGATGTILILFAAFCFVAAVWRELNPGARRPNPDVRKLPSVLFVGVNAFLVLVSIAALIGIWSTALR